MIYRELGVVLVLVLLALGAITSYVSVQIFQKHDAPLEEIAEDLVKDLTGISVDFTPGKE